MLTLSAAVGAGSSDAALVECWLRRLAMAAALGGACFTWALKPLVGWEGIWLNPSLLLVPVLLLLAPRPAWCAALWPLAVLGLSLVLGWSALHFTSTDTQTIWGESLLAGLAVLYAIGVAALARADWRWFRLILAGVVHAQFAYALFVWVQWNASPDVARGWNLGSGGQWLSLAGIDTQRLIGTFYEGPPFAQMMLMAALLLALPAPAGQDIAGDRWQRRWCAAAWAIAVLSAISIVSGQILLAVMCVMAGVAWSSRCHYRRAAQVLALGGLLLAPAALVHQVQDKMSRAEADFDPSGQSIGERAWHLRYVGGLVGEQPERLATGLGFGRYGDHACASLQFPDSVTMQNLPAQVVIEFGTLLLPVIAAVLIVVALSAHAWLGVAGLWLLAGVVSAVALQSFFLNEWFLLPMMLLANGGRSRVNA